MDIPDGLTACQIDHVTNTRRHASDINDIRSQRGAKCDSDHFIFRIKYRPNFSHYGNFDVLEVLDVTLVNFKLAHM